MFPLDGISVKTRRYSLGLDLCRDMYKLILIKLLYIIIDDNTPSLRSDLVVKRYSIKRSPPGMAK